MILRWVCKKCNRKWIYPITKCVHCKGSIIKQVGKDMKVVGITKVNIPSPPHPIIPYYTLILEDEHGNRMPKKVMKEYKIGDSYKREKAKTENAVSIIKIKYDVYEAVKEAIELISGIKVSKDSKIIIKPNIFASAYSYQALTTNPKTIKAIIEYLIEKGVTKENITIAEQVQFGEAEKAFAKSGFSSLAKEFGVKLLDLSKTEFIEKEDSEIKLEISKEFFNKDIIINVPVMKTHLLLGISGALENMSRIVSKKSYKELEKNLPKAIKAIAILNKLIPKYLTIGDATIGMQGNGPAQYGEPAFLNMILASKDPVALDKIFQEIGLLRKVEHIETASKLGIGSADLVDIEVVGENLDACRRELKPAIGSKLIKLK